MTDFHFNTITLMSSKVDDAVLELEVYGEGPRLRLRNVIGPGLEIPISSKLAAGLLVELAGLGDGVTPSEFLFFVTTGRRTATEALAVLEQRARKGCAHSRDMAEHLARDLEDAAKQTRGGGSS